MYLFFDTETTGVPGERYAPAIDTWNWPRVVQLAWTVTDEDGNELRALSFIVRPDGFEIPVSATGVHGITTQAALVGGKAIEAVLDAFTKDADVADTLVSHNITFDERVIRAELIRAGRSETAMFDKNLYCTMRSSKDFCKIRGRGGHKWPTLGELHSFLFGTDVEKAHDALADVRACAKCFFELKRQGVTFGWPVPDDDDPQVFEDQELFDKIFDLIDSSSWVSFDPSYVYNVYSQFEKRRTITDKQRQALNNIRDKLEEFA